MLRRRAAPGGGDRTIIRVRRLAGLELGRHALEFEATRIVPVVMSRRIGPG